MSFTMATCSPSMEVSYAIWTQIALCMTCRDTRFLQRHCKRYVQTKFVISGYSTDDNRPLPIGKNKNVTGMMKDDLGGKIMTELVAKMYVYRKIDKKVEDKRCKGTKVCSR